MKSNTLIIAAAGSGKTTYLANKACELTNQRILVTTYTESNEAGIKSMILKKKGFIPSHITVQTWVSFLLQHGVRPYQSVLDESLHNENIGFYLTNEKSGQKFDPNGEPVLVGGNPIYWGEDKVKKHYFTSTLKIYSDKLSKFVYHSNEKSDGKVVKRISDIFDYVFIDEVQDLAGFDLEIIKLLFQSNASVLLVGDPRQATYLTHHSVKLGKYAEGQIKSFVEQELKSKKISCVIDETTLNLSHRNNQTICDYSARLYPSLPPPIACSCQECRGNMSAHEGIFLVRRMDVEKYLSDFKPMQLRWSSSTKCNDQYPAQNFGESKGLTFERVLIYPTKDMIKWVKDNKHLLKNSTRAKLYVGLTRARRSSAIIMDYNDNDIFEGAEKYPFQQASIQQSAWAF
jgi:DNA helicase-2/ATP-dependent DNA helicase PcrA